jgi:hypothetical protein
MPWARWKSSNATRTAVIGTQMASAIEVERRHQTASHRPSPIAGLSYDFAARELDLFRFVESSTDQQLCAVVETAWASNDEAVALARDALTQDDMYTLLTFARRCAVAALRDRSTSQVVSGLRGMVLIDPQRIDWRDAAVAGALLAYAGDRLGEKARRLTAEVAGRAEPSMAEILIRHAKAPSKGLTLGGYREVKTSQGVGLASDYGKRYEPSVDLLGHAERIVGLIERDRYRVNDVTTGTDMPAVWLPAGDATTLQAREALRACLTVSARLESDGRGMPDHMFSVFLAEARNSHEAEDIANSAVPKPGSETALMGVASGKVCAVLVARSVVVGVAPLEGMQSLTRFREPLLQAITEA